MNTILGMDSWYYFLLLFFKVHGGTTAKDIMDSVSRAEKTAIENERICEQFAIDKNSLNKVN